MKLQYVRKKLRAVTGRPSVEYSRLQLFYAYLAAALTGATPGDVLGR